MGFLERLIDQPIFDGIAWGQAIRDGDHTTVFRWQPIGDAVLSDNSAHLADYWVSQIRCSSVAILNLILVALIKLPPKIRTLLSQRRRWHRSWILERALREKVISTDFAVPKTAAKPGIGQSVALPSERRAVRITISGCSKAHQEAE